MQIIIQVINQSSLSTRTCVRTQGKNNIVICLLWYHLLENYQKMLKLYFWKCFFEQTIYRDSLTCILWFTRVTLVSWHHRVRLVYINLRLEEDSWKHVFHPETLHEASLENIPSIFVTSHISVWLEILNLQSTVHVVPRK